MLQWETFIAAEMVHNLPLMNKVDGRSFQKHVRATHGSDSVISAKVDTQIVHHKMLDFGVPSQHGNKVLCCKERHPLLMKWFISFLWCIREMGGASWSICQPSMGHTVWYIWTVDSQIARKRLDFMYLLSTGNGMLCYNERHSLLLKWFIIFL